MDITDGGITTEGELPTRIIKFGGTSVTGGDRIDTIADVVLGHPEYHSVLEDGAALEHDYSPESGQSNPFLHMSMHLALIEQQHTDRPMGINKALIRLQRRSADAHDAQHRAMECLGQALWEAQRQGIAPDEQRFLKCVQSLGKRRR